MARKSRIEVKPHFRRPPGPKMASQPSAPVPGQNEFDADQEQQMRQGQRAANQPPPMMDTDGDGM